MRKKLPVPRGWNRHVKSSILQVLSLARSMSMLSGLDSAPDGRLCPEFGKIVTQKLIRPLGILGSDPFPERWIQI